MDIVNIPGKELRKIPKLVNMAIPSLLVRDVLEIPLVTSPVKKYIQRLKHSSAGEIIYQLKRAADNRYLKHRLNRRTLRLNVPGIHQEEIVQLNLPAFVNNVSDKQIDKILEGAVYSLNMSRADIQRFEKQYRGVFSGNIGFNRCGTDIRSVWEPARLQHITSLLFYRNNHSNRLEVEAFAKNQLLRWISDNPFLRGPHYASAMECGLRIPVFVYSLKLLGRLKVSDRQKILKAIYEHGWWISKRLSLYSSLGNHTVCEAVGLVFSGAVFRQTPAGTAWLHKGIFLLFQELFHQILDDGGPVEQSLHYQQFVIDLCWLAVGFLEQNDLLDCSNLKPRLHLGDEFLSTFDTGKGFYPSIGDSDGGLAVAPGMYPQRRPVGRGPKRAAGKSIVVTKFEASGYTVIRGNNGFHITFDHGPLGMPPLYNHGHADALSISLSKNGIPFLIDPGTYRYNGVSQWRRYFKSTRAHNTVTIAGQDQAIQETGFIWSRPYQCRLDVCRQIDGGVFMKATHDGYTRLKQPVSHSRLILWLDEGKIIIKDVFAGEGLHPFELNLHFHPDALLSAEEPWWVVRNGGTKIFVTMNHQFKLIKGAKNPILGWYSDAYGLKEPCSVLSCRAEGYPREVSFMVAICMDTDIELGTLEDRLNEAEKAIACS